MKAIVRWILHGIHTACAEIIDVVFPKLCPVCDRALIDGEDTICLHCWLNLPRAVINPMQENELSIKFIAKYKNLVRAAAMFVYLSGDRYTLLIHDTKYNSRPSVGSWLAEKYANELLPTGFFDDIDFLMPVPLHFMRELRRGYNQSEIIALAIEKVTGIPLTYNLVAARRHSTQTRRGVAARQQNAIGQFRLERPNELEGKHILVIDDVITTGSTMLSALDEICNNVNNVRVSVLSLAHTHMR